MVFQVNWPADTVPEPMAAPDGIVSRTWKLGLPLTEPSWVTVPAESVNEMPMPQMRPSQSLAP